MDFTVITSGISQAVTCFNGVWDMITDNPLAVTLVGIGVLSAAIGLFSRFKRSAAN